MSGQQVVHPSGLLATAGTPPALIERLNREMVAALHWPEVTERLFGSGVEVITATPAELAATVKAEMGEGD